jgi:hypothetical protein
MVVVESDDWQDWGNNILAPEKLAKIEKVVENLGPIILEHWFYRGGSAPDRLIFEDYESVRNYLGTRVAPGDAIHIWNYAELCRDDNSLTNGKYPDARGRTPKRGAY